MGKFGRQPINDCSKKAPAIPILFDGEERIDRHPRGKSERFIDPQGNIVHIVLLRPGEPAPMDTIARNRAKLHADGFVEHSKCPLRDGIRYSDPKIEADFAKMTEAELQRPCEAATGPALVKRGIEIHANKACRHVEWLIEARRKHEAEQAERRNGQRLAKEKQEAELKELQLQIAKEDLKARQARNGKARVGE